MMLKCKFVKILGQFSLFVGVQMGVGIQRSLNVFVTQTLSDQERRIAQFNEQRGVGMSEIVHTNLLHPADLAASYHLAIQEVLCDGKHSCFWRLIVQRGKILFELFTEESRYGNDAIALRCLGRCDDVLFPKALI